jgi:FAD/FMN-containing dehydrogenase
VHRAPCENYPEEGFVAQLSASVLAALEAILGAGKVLLDADSLNQYGSDWTKVYTPNPAAVVLPNSIEQVQAVVRLAFQEKLAIVPSGGRTGLSAGAVAHQGELVLALDNLNSITDFNPIDRTVCCGGGVITQTLQEYALEKDLFYPVGIPVPVLLIYVAVSAAGLNEKCYCCWIKQKITRLK